MTIFNIDEPLYFPAPPVILTTRKYQNVNADRRLQNMVTKKFLKKTKNWIKTDPNFKTIKKFSKKIESEEGYTIMHYILRLLVKRGNTNWYDLDLQEGIVKKYILFKLQEYV